MLNSGWMYVSTKTLVLENPVIGFGGAENTRRYWLQSHTGSGLIQGKLGCRFSFLLHESVDVDHRNLRKSFLCTCVVCLLPKGDNRVNIRKLPLTDPQKLSRSSNTPRVGLSTCSLKGLVELGRTCQKHLLLCDTGLSSARSVHSLSNLGTFLLRYFFFFSFATRHTFKKVFREIGSVARFSLNKGGGGGGVIQNKTEKRNRVRVNACNHVKTMLKLCDVGLRTAGDETRCANVSCAALII